MNFNNAAIISLGQNRILVGSGKRTWLKQPTDNSLYHFYAPDFFLTEAKPWFTHDHWEIMTLEKVRKLLKPIAASSQCQWNNSYEPYFRNAFADLQRRFLLKELQKAVPYVFSNSTSRMNSDMLQNALNNVLTYAADKAVHIYGFWDESQGILGATPEVLFQLEGNELKTMACAGTHRAGQIGSAADLLNNPKEMHEHKIVVDVITSALTPFGNVSCGNTGILQLPRLAHLVTPITAVLNEKASFESMVQALHPTPALGAAPRKEGMTWLKNYQTLIDRKRFGAPIGVTLPKDEGATCLVAIRNAQWDSSGISIGAGCGVVSGSKVGSEWEEIQAKIEATKQLLGL